MRKTLKSEMLAFHCRRRVLGIALGCDDFRKNHLLREFVSYRKSLRETLMNFIQQRKVAGQRFIEGCVICAHYPCMPPCSAVNKTAVDVAVSTAKAFDATRESFMSDYRHTYINTEGGGCSVSLVVS